MSDDALSGDDLTIVTAELGRLRAEPPPRDYGYLGCPLMIVSVLALVGLSASIARGFLTAGTLTQGLFWLGVGALVVGIFLAVTAGGFARGASIGKALSALEVLDAWDGSPSGRAEAIEAATVLLVHAVAHYGPTSSSSFDAAEVIERLGPKIDLVGGVERHLLSIEAGIYTVFTSDPGPGTPAEGS